MINLFDISNGKVIPSVHCHVIPQLKQIMEHFPNDYLNVYAYIFYLTCPDSTINPYVNQAELERETLIIADLKPTFYLEDLKILETIEWCKKMYETSTLRSWRGAKKMLERIGDYLNENEINDSGKDGNGMLIDKYMTKLGEYHDTYKKMDNEVKEEQAKVRGSIKLRYDFKPGYVDSKADRDDE